MSNELVVREMDDQKLDLIKKMYCKDSTDEELSLFLHVCKRSGLDPMLKQVYAIKRFDSTTKTMKMSIQTSIDGYRLIAERTGRYSPGREPSFTYQKDGSIFSSTAYVKKMTPDGTWHEIGATAFFNEYCQRTKEGRPTQFWNKMGHIMISKCAEALALRKAFPDYLSGIYTDDEMRQSDRMEETDKLEETKCEVTNVPSKMDLIKKGVDTTSETTIENRAKLIIQLGDILEDCGSEYENKICEHYKIKNIEGIPDSDLKKVIGKALAFRELKIKQQESQG